MRSTRHSPFTLGSFVLTLLALPVALASCAGPGQAEKGATSKASTGGPASAEIEKLRGPAREEVLALARLLAIRPAMAIDFSDTTGEYCLNTGSHVMTHFAVQPATTSEDIVYFVDAAPLVAKGLRLDEFPSLDPGLGKMQPNTWYLYAGKGTEPHHGREMSDRTWLMLAVDVQ